MTIVHIVLFKFGPEIETSRVHEICQHMVSLKDKCLHPKTGKPYIKSGMGGKNNSPEGHDQGLTHGFVVEFDNEEDRDYYLNKDPEHLAFVKKLTEGKLATGITVLDFVPGVM